MQSVNKCYRLGDYVLEPDSHALSRCGERVHLANLPFQVLVYLIEHRDRLVTRTELLDRFWNGKDVYDDSLRKTIGAIRKALEDSSVRSRFIETRWGGGYRYIGQFEERVIEPSFVEVDVVSVKGIDTVRTQSIFAKKRKVSLAIALALLLITTAGLMIRRLANKSSSEVMTSSIQSVAVLPLKNLTGDQANEYLSDGLTEGLITALSRIDGLRVVSRGSVFSFKGKDIPPQDAGRQLGVAEVLEGSVRQSGNRLRVDIRLVNVNDGSVIWTSETYESADNDLFAVQDQIALGVTSGLRLKLSGSPSEHLTFRGTNNQEAYQAYLRGRYFWNQRSGDGLTKSLEYFEQAIRIDPKYAAAYAGLARVHVSSIWFQWTPASEALAKAREAASRAVEIDDQLAEAHVALATVYSNGWDQVKGLREIERALTLEPNSVEAHHVYAYILVLIGRSEEAVAEIKRARDLDPLDITLNVDVGEILSYARHPAEAIEAFNKAIEMDPQRANAHWDLAEAYEQLGRNDDAVKEYLKHYVLAGKSGAKLATLQKAYQLRGIRGFRQARIDLLKQQAQKGNVPPSSFAALNAELGQTDKALTWLEKAYQQRSPQLINLSVISSFDSLRADPRFKDLLRRVGLPIPG